MGRIYTVPINSISVSSIVDIIGIKAGSHDLEVLDFRLGQSNRGQDAQEDEWAFEFARWGGGYTVGSNGVALSPQPNMSDDTAATFTARANDSYPTTNASGSRYLIEGDSWNVRAQYRPTWLPGLTPKIRPGEAWTMKLTKLPASATIINGTLFVKEGP